MTPHSTLRSLQKYIDKPLFSDPLYIEEVF